MAESSLARALGPAQSREFLRLERAAGRHERFAEIDRVAGLLLGAALSGRPIAHLQPGERGEKFPDQLWITALDVHDRTTLREAFTFSAQQARGAWFLPEQASLKVGALNLPAYLRRWPWHAFTIAHEDVARVQFAVVPDAFAAWVLLIPVFETVLSPIVERARGSADDPDTQRANWAAEFERLRSLGIRGGPALDVFTYGGGWSGLDRTGRAAAGVAFLDLLARHDPAALAAAVRATRIGALVRATVQKARAGTPLARQVLTKAHQPTLAAYFGGDWLQYLDYLDLPPNPAEEVLTALPAPRLYVQGSDKVARVAAEKGLPILEVEAMLAAFLGAESTKSPIEQRVAVVTRWWAEFDRLHAVQRPGMRPLWGLVDEGAKGIGIREEGPTNELHRELLPADLVADVDRLWDGLVIPRWPTTIVSELFPHRLMAETIGPALKFWNGVSLTAWYACEGPQSRTTVEGMQQYFAKDLRALEELGTPVHPSLFAELLAVDGQLPPYEEIHSRVINLPMEDGMAQAFVGGGRRRDGFERLRDVVTSHRQGWTGRYLREYLDKRWTESLTTVARELNRKIAAAGKAPSFKQFARFAETTANQWFSGDLSALYTAIGEKAPGVGKRVDLLPGTAHRFVREVYLGLGGHYYDESLRHTDFQEANRNRQFFRLAVESVRYLQLSEAIGHAPEPRDFGASRHQWDCLGGLEQGWSVYQRVVENTVKRLKE